jgi:hypothetical protein
MKQLPTRFDKSGWRFTQILRSGNVAIYRRKFIAGKSEHFEVIRIGCHTGKVIAGRVIEPAEVYPSAEDWGSRGWTFSSEEAARARFEALESAEGQVE